MLEIRWPARHVGLKPGHGYALFSALSHAGMVLHGEPGVQVAEIDRELLMRVAEPAKAGVLLSAGLDRLDVGGIMVELDEGNASRVAASGRLRSRLVVIKGAMCDRSFRTSLLKQLGLIGVSAPPRIVGRGILDVAGRKVVGYGVSFAGLPAAESILIQSHGLGGKQRMGCGVFLPC